ncbi:unnamed protein product [Staurois parvus]|uniref:Uncharacterized protein n=1 Tax=Staurois parvus TaxID=386267 RepID=A0ABN9B0K1_9NEOB|nr:unnamed protein product [Staurois parvus]
MDTGTGSFWLDSGHRSGTGSSGSDSGHRVNWPNRIVRLDKFIMLGRGIRPSRGFSAE